MRIWALIGNFVKMVSIFLFINDLILPDNKSLYTFNEFANTYNVNVNFVENYGIIGAISNSWKQIILRENIKLDRIYNEIVEK